MGIKVIGITGGIGCGKTTVAKIIADAGYIVIETDKLAKQVMNENPDVKKKIIQTFGNNSYNEDGSINPKYISELVYTEVDKSYNALSKLNQIVHPAVIDEMMRKIDELESNGMSIVFIESALIYEANLEEGFDYIIVVDCPKEKVIQRLKEKYGFSEKEIELRMNSQIPSSEKVKLADFVINNKGTLEDLRKSVEFLLNIL